MHLILIFVFGFFANAQSLSNSGVELKYQYTAEFRTLMPMAYMNEAEPAAYADFHAAHLFGLFHSPDYAVRFGYDTDMIEGFAGTKKPRIDNARFFKKARDPYAWVKYTASGEMLVLKKVAQQWLKGQTTGTVKLPLLRDLPAIYSDDLTDYRTDNWIKCTDSYYQSAGDFSYFYNPFRCPELGRQPIAGNVEFKLRLVDTAPTRDSRFPMERLRGDNGNGDLTVLYFAQGYDHTPPPNSSPQKIRADVGYRVFRKLERMLTEEYGFTSVEGIAQLRELLGDDMRHLSISTRVKETHYQNRVFYRTFVKKAGHQTYVVRSALLNSDPDDQRRPPVSFAKFWKEAWENGDFIYFGGHSGDGASLDVDLLNGKLFRHNRRTALNTLTDKDLRAIAFDLDKTQVAFIDACSSYDHYQDMYQAYKPRNLSIITYGLVSLFHNAENTIRQMLDLLTTPQPSAPTWLEVMRQIEERQLESHLRFLIDDPKELQKWLEQYRGTDNLPSFLINVE